MMPLHRCRRLRTSAETRQVLQLDTCSRERALSGKTWRLHGTRPDCLHVFHRRCRESPRSVVVTSICPAYGIDRACMHMCAWHQQIIPAVRKSFLASCAWQSPDCLDASQTTPPRHGLGITIRDFAHLPVLFRSARSAARKSLVSLFDAWRPRPGAPRNPPTRLRAAAYMMSRPVQTQESVARDMILQDRAGRLSEE